MQKYQIWIRDREAACSHTETVYIDAADQADAEDRAERLLREHFVIKAVLAPENHSSQEECGCGDSITWDVPREA